MLSNAGLAVFRKRNDALRAAPPAAPAAPANVAVSPVSVGVALAMLAAGAARSEPAAQPPADSATLRELRAALGHDKLGDEEALRAALRERVGALRGDGLFMANSLWLDSAVHEPFVRECQLVFGAEVRPLAGKGPINEHVERASDGLVRGLLAQDPHSNVLLNVFALRLRWFAAFDAAHSQQAVFHAFDGDRPCRMMRKKEPRRLSVGRVRCSTVLLLPYANASTDDLEDAPAEHEAMDDDAFRFCAVFVLPDREGAPALAEGIEHVFGDISAAVSSAAASTQRATVSLPAFRVQTGTVSLKSELQALGVRRAFAPDEAELTRMAPGRAWVDDVLHSVVIDVDEKGTVAAAATAVATTRGRSPPVVHVQIDRPFGFGVYDLRTEETLFVASVVDPAPPP